MRRDVERLRRAARLVTDDLRRVLGVPWSCEVDGYVLTVSGPAGTEEVALIEDIEDEGWYVRPDMTPEEQDDALDADAEEVVALEVVEVLDVLGVRPPPCPEHGTPLTVCTGTWLCTDRGGGHDVAVVGRLGVA